MGPQVSLPVQPSEIVPQLAPFASQVVSTQSMHLPFVQVFPVAQVPQSLVVPVAQASLIFPHSACAATHTSGIDVFVGQVQLRSPPQPSESCPQVPAGKSVHFFLAHAPQVKVKASQAWPLGQVPQSEVLPQPSGILPQCPEHETGVQARH